ncbi:MAG: CGLD27 family protein [Leptolyngbyaceae bacterium]|nr:CGLD27 family protein [Leptolyngbyaceae bacterium]
MLTCPVPLEQRPVQEYEDLKQSWFFGWACTQWFDFLKPIVIVWGISWLMAGPIAAASFPIHKYPLQFSLSAAGGALVIPVLLLVRLYLGWVYIRDRLTSDIVTYEESGWYDGQTWPKPDEVIQRDRLIATYQVTPILIRLRKVFGVILGILGIGSLIWFFMG